MSRDSADNPLWGTVQLQAVESANVVGYVSTANLIAGRYYLIGQNFQSVTGGSVDLQAFITSSDMLGGEEDQGPNLKLWAGTGYDDYYLLTEDMDGKQNVWSGDGFFAAEDVTVDLAKGAFLKVKNNCTITVAGQVADGSSMNVPLNPNAYNLIANPFPIAFDINGNKVAWADALIGGEEDQGPNLKLWAGTGYDDYYFLAEDMDGKQNVWSGDGFFAAEDVLVQPGSGFWLKYTNNPSGVNLKFSK